MKTFNGIKIETIKPAINQVWSSVTGELFVIYLITDDRCYCEKENGDRFALGYGWFDELTYQFKGVISK